MSRKRDQHKDVLLGVALGTAVTGVVAGVVSWMFGKSEQERRAEAVAVESARNEVLENKVSVRVIPACELRLFKGETRFSNESGLFTISAGSLSSVTHWSASQPCQLQYQRRTGEWTTLDTIHNTSQIRGCRLPITNIGSKLVDILCFPPNNYHPVHSESGTCSICLDHAADVQLIGNTPEACGHLALCWVCLQELRTPECPICRKEIAAISYNYRT